MANNNGEFYREIDFLFRRFNFFLLATSFLVAGFVAVVVTNMSSRLELTLLAHAIAALGSFLSAAFFVVNFMAAKVAMEIKKEKKNEPVKWLRESHKDVINFLKNPLTFSKDNPASHTWFIPLVFCSFWLAAWWIVLSWVVPVAFFGTLLFVSLVVYTRRCTKKRGKILWTRPKE